MLPADTRNKARKSKGSVLAGMQGNSLPSKRTPLPPKGFVAPAARDLLGSHPRQAEVALAPDVMEELAAFRDYDATFGSMVPASEDLVALIAFATSWRQERAAAAAWNLYVRAQDAVAWKVTLAALDELKPAFKLALTRRPGLRRSYPRLVAFFDAHKQIAQRALATKRKKTKTDEAV
jgi:hypothetical protein